LVAKPDLGSGVARRESSSLSGVTTFIMNKQRVCAIIGSYTKTHLDTALLSLTIEGIKRRGYKTCLATHAPVSHELQKSVDYFIYTDENQILNPEFEQIAGFYYNGSNFYFRSNYSNTSGAHSFAILMNIKNSLWLMEKKGFTHFIYFESDSFLNQKDHEKLEEALSDKMLDLDYWFMNETYNLGDQIFPVTSIFSGRIEYFSKNTDQIFSPDGYLDFLSSGGNCTLESFFLKLINTYPGNGTIEKNRPRDFFSSEWIGISSGGNIALPGYDNLILDLVDVVRDYHSNDSFFLVFPFINSGENVGVKVYLDGVLNHTREVIPNGIFHYFKFNFEKSSTIKVEFHYLGSVRYVIEKSVDSIRSNQHSYFKFK